ncbi:hypothetical protein ROHU_021832 [Labeo rohita]|uniref:Uncharacterized protein n=1 Tax=Labeo rohita TaxID=84645 RepID=A0A498MT12_LABRO|nr:hypothetical protein ROHU_021832 [Labeo rohita]
MVKTLMYCISIFFFFLKIGIKKTTQDQSKIFSDSRRGASTLPPSLPSPGRGASFHVGPRLNLLQRDRVATLQVGSHLLQELAPVSEPGTPAKSQAPAWLPYPSSGCAYCSLFPLNEPPCRRPVLDTIRRDEKRQVQRQPISPAVHGAAAALPLGSRKTGAQPRQGPAADGTLALLPALRPHKSR